MFILWFFRVLSVLDHWFGLTCVFSMCSSVFVCAHSSSVCVCFVCVSVCLCMFLCVDVCSFAEFFVLVCACMRSVAFGCLFFGFLCTLCLSVLVCGCCVFQIVYSLLVMLSA